MLYIIYQEDRPDGAAEAFSREEPFRKAGLFGSVKISRMRRGQWNPAAAPESARRCRGCGTVHPGRDSAAWLKELDRRAG